MDYVPLIQSGITVGGVVLATVIAALLAVWSYRRQKNLERKQEHYEQYIKAFMAANFWNIRKQDETEPPELRNKYHQLHLDAQARYQETFESLLLVAPNGVHDRATAFHRSYVKGNAAERGDELRAEYAKMVQAMRDDGFAKGMTLEEVKDRITWDV